MDALKISILICLSWVLYGCGVPGRSEPLPEDPGQLPEDTGPLPDDVIPAAENFGTVTVAVPEGMVSTYEYTWVASWDGGTAPYTISWDFGGGAENIPTASATSPSPTLVRLTGAGGLEYTFTIVVSDAEGLESQATGTYAISPVPDQVPDIIDDEPEDPGDEGEDDIEPVPNEMPTIELVSEELGTIIVSVDDSDDEVVAVYATEIPGMIADYDPQIVAVPGTAVFHFMPDENYFVTSGTTTITVDDGNGGTAAVTVDVNPHVPDEFIFTAEYDRRQKVLTLRRDFSHSDWINLQFEGPAWIDVRGAWEHVVPGGWSSLEFDVVLDTNAENFNDITISAYAQFDPANLEPISPVYEATVHVTRPIYISKLAYDNLSGELTLEVDLVDGAEIEVTSEYTNGITATELAPHAENPNQYSAQIDYSASPLLYGYAIVAINDQDSNTDREQVWLQHESAGIDDGGLYAYYDKEQVSTGESVLVTVVTGKLSHPFRFLLNAGVVTEGDADYVEQSFNVGSPGGARDFPDGIWSDVQATGFFLAPDHLFMPGANPEDSLGTKERYDFNVSPSSGIDFVDGIGDLFNFEFRYSEPGLKTLTFQVFNGVNRTYYGCVEESVDHFWVDSTNSHGRLQTSIVVE